MFGSEFCSISEIGKTISWISKSDGWGWWSTFFYRWRKAWLWLVNNYFFCIIQIKLSLSLISWTSCFYFELQLYLLLISLSYHPFFFAIISCFTSIATCNISWIVIRARFNFSLYMCTFSSFYFPEFSPIANTLSLKERPLKNIMLLMDHNRQ